MTVQQSLHLLCILFVVLVAPFLRAEEIVDPNFVEYGDVTEDYPYYYDNGPPVCAPADIGSQDCLDSTDFVLNDFVVADVNLASYNGNPNAVPVPKPTRFQPTTRPFPLFPDFDIGSLLRGNETWMELILIRRHLQRPSLTFYSDKVARKRWLGERGYPQPRMFFAAYADQLQEDYRNHKEELAAEIFPHLPTTHGFAAKPNHMVSG
jgi:hypothetical protein